MKRRSGWGLMGRAVRRGALFTRSAVWLVVAGIAWAIIGSLAGCAGGAQATSLSTSTVNPGATPTFTPVPFVQPHVGDLEARFVEAYGQPYQTLPEEDVFWTDSSQTVAVGVRTDKGIAVHINVAGNQALDYPGTFAQCALFLPADAKVYATPGPSTSPVTVFTSSIGEILLANHSQGACEVYLGGH